MRSIASGLLPRGARDKLCASPQGPRGALSLFPASLWLPTDSEGEGSSGQDFASFGKSSLSQILTGSERRERERDERDESGSLHGF